MLNDTSRSEEKKLDMIKQFYGIFLTLVVLTIFTAQEIKVEKFQQDTVVEPNYQLNLRKFCIFLFRQVGQLYIV